MDLSAENITVATCGLYSSWHYSNIKANMEDIRERRDISYLHFNIQLRINMLHYG